MHSAVLVSPRVLVLLVVVWILLVPPLVTMMVMGRHIVSVVHGPIVHIVLVVCELVRLIDAGDILGNGPKSSYSFTRIRVSTISLLLF